MFPSLLEVSRLQIKKHPNTLPADIKKWLDSATNGAIFFSFGSNLEASHMTTEKRTSILNVFAKLKQKVLWKWEDENLPGKPDNVMIGKWLPQDDIRMLFYSLRIAAKEALTKQNIMEFQFWLYLCLATSQVMQTLLPRKDGLFN